MLPMYLDFLLISKYTRIYSYSVSLMSMYVYMSYHLLTHFVSVSIVGIGTTIWVAVLSEPLLQTYSVSTIISSVGAPTSKAQRAKTNHVDMHQEKTLSYTLSAQ